MKMITTRPFRTTRCTPGDRKSRVGGIAAEDQVNAAGILAKVVERATDDHAPPVDDRDVVRNLIDFRELV